MNEIREILDKQRQAGQFYLKLDVGLLAAAISIFTILKLQRIEIVQTVYSGRLIFFGIVVLIVYGLLFDWWALIQWSRQSLSANQQSSVLSRSKLAMTIQHVLHVLFIGLVSTYIIGFTGGYGKAYNTYKELVAIQIGIEKFKVERKTFPLTLEDVIERYPYVAKNIRQLDKDRLQYRLNEDKGYVLRFAGDDGNLGTKDDVVADHKSFIEKMDFDYPASNKVQKEQ